MKKANNLVLLLILVSFQLTLFSQNGNVQSFIKISQTQANFPITLLNGANFGHALACIGDLNNDGIQDVAISSVNGSDDGTLYISFLDSGGTVNSIVEIKQGLFGLPTNQTYEMDWFGYSVDTIGDLNQDGVIDLVVGLPNIVGGNAKGFVFILFMNDDGTVNSFKILGENLNGFNENLTDTYFGSSVAGLGDLDFDGIYDIVVGGPGKDNDNGAIWILYLNIDGTLKSKIRIDKNTPLISSYFLQSSSSIINFGSSIESLGDLDKDGVIDIIVGSANYSTIYGFGSAAILFLNANGSIKELNAIQPGVTNFNDTLNPVLGFGKSISNIGDVNGDEISDLAFTSPVYSESQCTQCGAVWIVMMDSVGSVKGYQRISDSLGSFSGNLAYNDYFGGASSGIGDFNGDLVADVVISAKRDDDGGQNRGAVYILNLNGVPDSTYFLGIEEQHVEMALYPNPVNEFLTIDLSNITDVFQKWQLYDMQGHLMRESVIPHPFRLIKVSTSQLPTGIYILNIYAKNKTFTRKVVVSRR